MWFNYTRDYSCLLGLQRLSLLLTGFMSLAPLLYGCAQIQSEDTAPKMAVLLHGAHLTADTWGAVKGTLSQHGLNVIALDLPGRKETASHQDITLAVSSRSLCDSLQKLQGDITVVAHSQAGAVVNHAFSICPHVDIDNIIYLAAVAPMAGEKPFDKLSTEDEANYLDAVAYDAPSGSMKIFDVPLFWRLFGFDHSVARVEDLEHYSVDEPAAIGEGVVEFDSEAFAKPKKFYIFTRWDQIISLSSQHVIASNLELTDSAVIDSGHVPMITDHTDVADAVLRFIRNH